VILSALSVALGSSVKSDYQKDFDFSRLRTFNFKTERASNDRTSQEERLAPAVTWVGQAGQAPLPDLFIPLTSLFSADFTYLGLKNWWGSFRKKPHRAYLKQCVVIFVAEPTSLF
jgi:hypothetical protein